MDLKLVMFITTGFLANLFKVPKPSAVPLSLLGPQDLALTTSP